MLMEMSQMGMDMEASADVIISEKPEDVAMSMTMSMPGTDSEMKMIMIGTDAYMNMGEMTQNKFAKLSLDELDGAGMGNLNHRATQRHSLNFSKRHSPISRLAILKRSTASRPRSTRSHSIRRSLLKRAGKR